MTRHDEYTYAGESACAYGTWKLPREQAAGLIRDALETGYRHIDTAAAYANEAEIGEGIRASGIARDELYVSGKLWNSKRSYDAAIKACRRSLKNLGLAYFDQYLIHWPASPKQCADWESINAQAWRALETLYGDGLARRIGVCNYKTYHLDALLPSARVNPMVNQIELHPGHVQLETVAFCRSIGMRLEAWSPLGNGQLIRTPSIVALAKKYGCSAAQLCLRWCIQYGAKPITKAASTAHMRENLSVDAISITNDDMTRLTGMKACAFSGMDPDEVISFA